MARIRTFVAIPSTTEIQVAGAELTRQISAIADGIRWVAPEQMHLTVKFLGDVEDREVYSVCDRVRRISEQYQSFGVACEGVGAFPTPERPRTLWIGVRDEAAHLSNLQRQIDDAMCQLGFPAEARKYHGHFTLGRIRSRLRNGTEVAAFLAENADRDFGSLNVDRLVVYASELTRQGPTYTTLGTCPLAA